MSFSSRPRRARQRIRRRRAASSEAPGCPSMGSDGPADQQVLDLADRLRGVQALGADIGAVHDRMAAEQPIRILEIVQPLAGRLVSAVADETVGLQQPGRPDVLVGVPPERRARGGTAGAEDALVQAIELVALLGALQALLLRRRRVVR